MTSPAGLRFKTSLLIFVMIAFGPLGDILLGKGVKRVGAPAGLAPAELFHFFLRAFASQTVWFGVGSLMAFFLAYICVLSWADYSYVQPASSMAYAVVALLGYLVLGEAISPLRWIGVFTICAGVFIVGHTPPRTTDSSPC
jgi:drug/metabolite transporter (DMT)-like permease